jgi:hypothetical protein
MTNPWVISKIAHPLTPDRDIDPHGPKHDAQFFDTLTGNCITKVNAVVGCQIPPGFDDLQRDRLCAVFESMRATHKGLRDLLKNQVHPSSVDALCLVRAQLETLYTIWYVVEKGSSVNDFLKNDWKNRYVLPRKQCRGTLEVFKSRIERTSGRMTASVTWQNKDSQSTRLLELRERVQTNESDCAVNTGQCSETSGSLQATPRHRRRARRHSNSRRPRADPIH